MQAVVSHHAPVVRGENDEGVAHSSAPGERFEHASQFAVDVGDLADVADPHPVVLLGRQGASPSRPRQARAGHVVSLGPVADGDLRERTVDVHVPEEAGRVIR